MRAGLTVEEVELDLAHRATGRDARGFLHRGRQLADVVLACGPTAVNHRGLRLPLAGWAVAVAEPSPRRSRSSGSPTISGAAPSAASARTSAPGRRPACSSSPRSRSYGLVRTRSLSGALLVGLSANALNQLDTKPGRALKAFFLASALLGFRPRKAVAAAVLLAPYDLREMAMLGDSGANALGALLGCEFRGPHFEDTEVGRDRRAADASPSSASGARSEP